jgi:hypothetical protein
MAKYAELTRMACSCKVHFKPEVIKSQQEVETKWINSGDGSDSEDGGSGERRE